MMPRRRERHRRPRLTGVCFNAPPTRPSAISRAPSGDVDRRRRSAGAAFAPTRGAHDNLFADRVVEAWIGNYRSLLSAFRHQSANDRFGPLAPIAARHRLQFVSLTSASKSASASGRQLSCEQVLDLACGRRRDGSSGEVGRDIIVLGDPKSSPKWRPMPGCGCGARHRFCRSG